MKSARPSALRLLLAALALVAALAFSACGSTKDESSSSGSSNSSSSSSDEANPNAEIKQGLKTVSIPKQLGNPYEEFEHSGVDQMEQTAEQELAVQPDSIVKTIAQCMTDNAHVPHPFPTGGGQNVMVVMIDGSRHEMSLAQHAEHGIFRNQFGPTVE